MVGEAGLVTSHALGRAAAVRIQLESDASAPGRARLALDDARGTIAAGMLPAAKLLVSELVTNSVRHAALAPHQRIRLEVVPTERGVHVEVADPGPGFSAPGPAPLEDVRGRGLLLVDELADRWGVAHGDLTRVWFELDGR